MEGQWTFSDIEQEWVHDTFDTREEAIEEAKEWYDVSFLIGQLEHESGINYKVINIDEVKA